MEAGNAIEVKNLKKKFKVFYDKGSSLKEKLLFTKRNQFEDRWVINGISFHIKKGEAVGLIGKNGCGKSTTLKMLTKIMYPTSGSIEVCGRVSSLLELGAGFHPDMSGRENIYINASIFGLTKKEIDRRISDIIAFSELEDYIDNPVRTYSSGMYMRLAFSVAINVDADVLLIDEILAVGDISFQTKCFERLEEIKESGTTIVIVSHSMGQIEQICDRAIWIEDGLIREDGLPGPVSRHYLASMEEKRLAKLADAENKKNSEENESQTSYSWLPEGLPNKESSANKKATSKEGEKTVLGENENTGYRNDVVVVQHAQNCLQAIENIQITQKSRVYKTGLIIRRFFVQFFKEGESADFIKWGLGKLIKKDFHTRYLCDFDYLENTRQYLISRKHSVNENVGENISMVRKEMSSVIIFASVPYFDVGGGQRSAQMAKTFNSLGYQVHYIYGFDCSEENVPDMFIPAITHKKVDEIHPGWFKSVITPQSIVIFEIPYKKFKDYLTIAKRFGCYTVYEHIDNWATSLGNLFYEEEVFRTFTEQADLITVTARLLGEKIGEVTAREYLYLPNAVNTELFEPSKNYDCPKDLVLARKGGKTLLYFGSLWGEWFDWEKIEFISEQCKDCQINLIGDYSGIRERTSSIGRNVHFLGLKKQSELPAYLKYADIALLPFKNCEIGKYVSPLKIFEYIAMNKKVIAAALDDIQNYPNVCCSDNKEDWVKLIAQETPVVDASGFTDSNNWFARCGELIKRAASQERTHKKISVVILNYNNRNVIERCVNTLAAHNSRYSYEIIVVDNGSTDGSFEFLKETYGENILLLQNNRNGCSSGRNLGAAQAKGEYLCFLDSDQWVISDYWLDSALQILESKEYVGAVSWNAGWFAPGETTGPIVDGFANRSMDNPAAWFRLDIAYLATSGLLMEKKLFEDIGGFDTYYDPTCYEDTDLSLKIRDFGLEIAYCPYMSIMHLPHQTTKSGSPYHTELMNKNGNYFYEKWKKRNPELLEYYL